MTRLLIRLFVKNADQTTNPKVRSAYGLLASITSIVCNLLLVGGKLAVGFFTGSISITADAINNLGDATSSIVTLIGFRMAAKPADREHPFGHARSEYIAGLTVSVLIMALGINLVRESIGQILSPQLPTLSIFGVIVLAVSILIKLWMAYFNRSIGRRIDSEALRATFADSRNDVIVTAAVLASAFIAHFTGLALDGWVGLAVAVFILVSGFMLVRDTLNPLLGMAPSEELVQLVAKKILSYPKVLATHDLIVHDYGPGRRFASAHVEMSCEDDVMECHDIIDTIERDFLENEQINLILHYDPLLVGDAAVDSAREGVAAALHAINPQLGIHDFRMVDGPMHTNYIFDVEVPPEFPLTQKELEHRIEKAVQHGPKHIYIHITVDTSYAPIPKQSPPPS